MIAPLKHQRRPNRHAWAWAVGAVLAVWALSLVWLVAGIGGAL